MTGTSIGFNPYYTTGWDLLIEKNFADVGENDPIIESYDFVKPHLQVGTIGAVFIPLSSGLVKKARFARVLSDESATAISQEASPSVVQAFFQQAESKLSAETEITAQVALGLLRRIKAIVAENYPNNIKGCIFALVDAEDGSTTIEGVRNRSRLGFVLDRDNESSWFVVLPNGESDSGYLYGKDGLKTLSGLLEGFVSAEQ